MKKLITYTANHLAYNVPVVRQATIYSDCEADPKGRAFEVSTHTGAPGVMWEFQPFATLEEAMLHALRFLGNSKINHKLGVDS